MKKLIAGCLLILALAGCETPPPPPPPGLTTTPDLSGYSRFELFSQASVATGQLQAEGTLKFNPANSQFDVFAGASGQIGRFHVQVDACRDDPSPDCQRHYVAAGRIAVLGASMNCTVPIRNDSILGYAQQTFSGICQSQYGRTFTINLIGK